MKCESCGATLTLENLYCPYCGKENAAVKQHVQDMAHYKGEFETTQRNVYEKANAYTHNIIKIAIVAVLAIVWVIMLILTANAWEIKDAINQANNHRNFEEIEAQIWQYLEEEEYYALSVYCNEKSIRTYDTEYEQYEPIIRAANQYQYVFDQLMGCITPSSYDEDLSDDVEYFADYLNYFYEVVHRDWEEYSYRNVYDMDLLQPELQRMEEKVQVLLITYVGLTQEEAQQLPTMTSGQRMSLLEEGLLYENQ